jgi:hypothetical protein
MDEYLPVTHGQVDHRIVRGFSPVSLSELPTTYQYVMKPSWLRHHEAIPGAWRHSRHGLVEDRRRKRRSALPMTRETIRIPKVVRLSVPETHRFEEKVIREYPYVITGSHPSRGQSFSKSDALSPNKKRGPGPARAARSFGL